MQHPVFAITGIMLAWMLVTSLSGTLPWVSLKYFLARLWFIAGFLLLPVALFTRRRFIYLSLTVLMAGMVPVVIYHIVGLSGAGLFNQQAAHVTMWPFFNDHTSFGSALAFVIPVNLYLTFSKGAGKYRVLPRSVYFMMLLLFSAGLILSYSRAAWISLAVSAVWLLIMIARIPFKAIIAVFLVATAGVLFSWQSIILSLERNSQQSSANVAEHLRSVTNISSDASNLERINRWRSALRMSAEKPLLGWGPGTYQFKYAPYQRSTERTSISTNFGDRGNAHSEYLGAMVDSGIPGAILFILLVLVVLSAGYRSWRVPAGNDDRYLSLSVQAGLVTYFAHAMLNNFLDTDKISAPFWIFIAILVVLDPLFKTEKPESGEKRGNY